MFRINYRIVDDFEKLKNISSRDFDNEWNHISGFFQICFGEHKEGCYYHENPLGVDEFGEELLDYWFDQLLCTIELLETKTDYVAFREIETVKRWLEFKRDKENVTVNVVLNDSEKSLLTIKPFNEFLYIEPENFTCTWTELKRNVIRQIRRFFNELQTLNPQLMESEIISELVEKYRDFECYYDERNALQDNWEDVSVILYDGNKEDIRKLRCPVCGGKISYSFDMEVGSNTIKCDGSCGAFSRGYGDISYIPNCVKYFGEVYTTE